MRTLSTLERALTAMEDALVEKPYSVTGFMFALDSEEETFDPYCLESASVAGFHFESGQPIVEGFFYLSSEYQAYLEALVESGNEHPHNKACFPWCSFDSEPL